MTNPIREPTTGAASRAERLPLLEEVNEDAEGDEIPRPRVSGGWVVIVIVTRQLPIASL